MVVEVFQIIFFCLTMINLQEFYINIELRYLSFATYIVQLLRCSSMGGFQNKDFDLFCVNILKHLSHHKNSMQQ